MGDFWDFTYEPEVIETSITTTETTTNNTQYGTNTTIVTTQTKQVDVVTNWGDIARFGVILLMVCSICWVAGKLVTFWRKER
ncbi:MAG: hypothetical protein LBR76_05350 [Oscillospiraceae bacterium]|jgi:hypothetical protein|nr:hypothetical protein [Oscillospiraceae bacterium]